MANPELTIARIFSEPDLNGAAPQGIRFAPDGRSVTFLRASEGDLNRLDLWRYSVETGKSEMLVSSREFAREGPLSDQEKANRERRRIAATGVVEYLWSPTGSELLFPVDGTLYRYSLAEAGTRTEQVTPDGLAATDPAFAPSGELISFVAEQNLHVVARDGSPARQLTFDGAGTVSNGVADFIAQEEMHRYKGYWWSPDSRRLAFIQTDEAPIPVTQRYEIDGDEFRVYDQRYPYAGMMNVTARLGIIELADGSLRWLDLGPASDLYVARVTWLPDGERIAVQLEARNQQRLELYLYRCSDGGRRHLVTEESGTWLNLQQEPWFLKRSPGMIWTSERSGYRHLHLYDLTSGEERPLTSGEWCVHRLVRVDEEANRFYFTAGIATPIESHLYHGDLQGEPGEGKPITREPGCHQVEISRDCSHFIDHSSNTDTPPRVALRRIDGTHIAWLAENDPREGAHPYSRYLDAHAPARFGTVPAADGQLLHYRLTPPSPCSPDTRYPCVLLVYGGPGVRRVRNEWCGMWHQYLARHGFGVLELDNRGSSDRGVAFETPIYRRLGDVEVADQLQAVELLRSLPWADGERIGVYGHSYGGYMTLLLMMRGGGAFRAGVAVAPVTDWRLYDTHYTERYLDHPDANPEGYEQSSVFPHLEGLKGELMIMHGMADDNVLFTHTTKLIKALQERNLKFTMMAYPGAKHGLGGREVSIHRFETVAEFFDRTLGQPETKR